MLEHAHKIPAIFDAFPLPSILVVCMFADILTGLMVAIATKTVSSSISLRGMFGKVSILIVWSVCALVEPQLKDQIGMPTGKIAAFFFIINEIISILENSAKLGVPLPAQLVDTLLKLRYANKPVPLAPPSTPVSLETHIHTDNARVDITKSDKIESQKIVIEK